MEHAEFILDHWIQLSQVNDMRFRERVWRPTLGWVIGERGVEMRSLIAMEVIAVDDNG
jgi:hypothetical protein